MEAVKNKVIFDKSIIEAAINENSSQEFKDALERANKTYYLKNMPSLAISHELKYAISAGNTHLAIEISESNLINQQKYYRGPMFAAIRTVNVEVMNLIMEKSPDTHLIPSALPDRRHTKYCAKLIEIINQDKNRCQKLIDDIVANPYTLDSEFKEKHDILPLLIDYSYYKEAEILINWGCSIADVEKLGCSIADAEKTFFKGAQCCYPKRYNPLYLTMTKKDCPAELVLLILEKVFINERYDLTNIESHITILHLAIEENNEAVFNELLKKEYTKTLLDFGAPTPITLATKLQRPNMMRRLWEKGANINKGQPNAFDLSQKSKNLDVQMAFLSEKGQEAFIQKISSQQVAEELKKGFESQEKATKALKESLDKLIETVQNLPSRKSPSEGELDSRPNYSLKDVQTNTEHENHLE